MAKALKQPAPDLNKEPARAPVQYTGMLIWENGQPRAVVSRNFDGPKTGPSLKSLMQEVLNLPYTGSHPDYQGLTKGEAMILAMTDRAAAGDLDAVKEILDRIMGRPTQSIQSVKVTGTLEEFLDAMGDHTPEQAEVIDIKPTPKPQYNVEDLF